MVVTPPLDDDARKFLGDYFGQSFPGCGLYLLQPESKGRLVCNEKITSLDFALREDAATLTNFAKQFNITEIFADNMVKYDSPAVVDWINGCGLPVNVFSLKES